MVVTHYFFPENFRINDLAIGMKEKGHNISVLTSIPNYPGPSYYKGYGLNQRREEDWNGIKIRRSPLIPRGSGSNLMLAISWLSSVLGGLFSSIFHFKKKYDVIFVFAPSPILTCLPAIFIKRIKKIPICLWVLDLWPESVTSAGNLQSSLIPKLLNPVIKYIYKNSDKVLVSSNGFINAIMKKGITPNKIEFFPQWAESIFKPISNYKNLLNDIPSNSFKIMFAGNIGEAQDFFSIIEAAKILKSEKHIHWIILGSGRKEPWLRKKIIEYNLNDCFHLLGRHPIDKMPEFYAEADCMLFSLKKEYIFSITIPAKVQSYLACAKPIIAMIDGEGSKIINNSNAGLSCASGDSDQLAKNIKKLSLMDKNDLTQLGENGLAYYNKYFERNQLLNILESRLLELSEKYKR